MNPIRLMGKAFYSKWIESITHCEPKFEELPECYLLQLDGCIRAALLALAQAEPNKAGWDAGAEAFGAEDGCLYEMIKGGIKGFLFATAQDGERPLNQDEADAA